MINMTNAENRPVLKNQDVKPEDYAELRRALTLISGKG